jgi:hypothetical protein
VVGKFQKRPESALSYDFEGPTFTHVGERVTFGVVAASFGLEKAPAIARQVQLMHFIYMGGIAVDEASRLELLVRRLQAQHADAPALLAAALPLFDTVVWQTKRR